MSTLVLLIFVILIICLLFYPSSWGYDAYRSPVVALLVVLLIILLLFHVI